MGEGVNGGRKDARGQRMTRMEECGKGEEESRRVPQRRGSSVQGLMKHCSNATHATDQLPSCICATVMSSG